MMQAFAPAGLLLLCSASLFGQGTGAEITGTVSDASGGLVPNATVTITNAATNAQRTLTTNASGIYDAPSLSPGVYSVKVATTGFRSDVRNNVELQVGQVARLDFDLQVGNISDTVEVQAATATLDTETSSVGTVIESRRISDLPLNGRNYLQLASLVPGATTYGPGNFIAQARGGGDRANFQLNVSGQRLEFNHYMLDGIENTDPNYGTYLFQPSVDALQEFKLETSTYSAEYGRNMAQVNVITKSGTNQFHGAAFEFLRNSQLDAKNYFDSSVKIPPFRRNQFGAVIGGPVRIPHLFDGRNKLFFLFNYEGLRQAKSQTALSAVPNALDRTGDFSASSTPIYDPSTRVLSADGSKVLSALQFPGNIIPASRIHPNAAFYFANFYPLPNNGAKGYSGNFISNESATANSDGELTRVDWQQSTASTFAFRYSHSGEPQYTPAALPQQGAVNLTITHESMLSHTLILGGNKVNEFKFGISRLEQNNGELHSNDPNADYVKKLGVPYVVDTPLFWGIPFVQLSNFQSAGDPANGPYANWDTLIQFTDHFSWNKGRHSLKFGADILRTRFNLTGNDVARGRFTFSGIYTSPVGVSPQPQNAVADFLLGDMSNAEGQLGQVVAMLRSTSSGFYFQDQWKVTPKLTVNYGMRYELAPGLHEKYDHLTNIAFKWDNSMQPTWVRAGTGDFYEGYSPFHLPSYIPINRGMFGNTIYRTDRNDFGPRIGAAWSVNGKTVIRAGFGIYYVHDIGNAMFDVARNMPFTLRIQQTANSITPNETWSSPFPILSVSTLAPAWQWGDPTSYVPQWSLNVQRGLTKDLSLEVGYVGSSGVHLDRTTYYNEPPPGGPTSNLNARRPFPQLGFVQVVQASSHSSYHSLQARLQQRFAHGFTLLSSFSWEKSMDNGSGVRQANGDSYVPQDVNNLAGERGLSAFNFGLRSTTSFLYQIPVGRGRMFAGKANKLVDALIGGWQFGAIFTAQGGFPFSIGCQSNATYQNTDTTCRADATGLDPQLPNPTPNNWFNLAAFTNRQGFVAGTGPYRFGTSGRNVVIGPGITELDASLFKSFALTETSRLDFRSEFFNLPNHPILGQPGSTVGSTSYGAITSTRLDSRQIQFALKLVF
jgi:hypothetical protein